MKSLGYGTVPKAVMLDRRLDIQAKGIYIYFCSFTDWQYVDYCSMERT